MDALSLLFGMVLHAMVSVDHSTLASFVAMFDPATLLAGGLHGLIWILQATPIPVTYDFDTNTALSMSSTVFNAFSPVLAVAVGFGLAGGLLFTVKTLF